VLAARAVGLLDGRVTVRADDEDAGVEAVVVLGANLLPVPDLSSRVRKRQTLPAPDDGDDGEASG
jgi:hypothetical protein